ncbi:class I adenylate-forming enzyme family protein [Variovorax sp. YR216]|uniref:class I adenylate-forming enzyme family protein n=1 Tax=Variovorax sp. YR216 TaxID=1882828 RepID=UPI000895F2FC|nr:class I adenylate-forming enzyme family protein [Variovorax sp. YR216]SEB20025.1 Acyl-CoA synthetase (AMP-forming)/AMP-acid ligase II [Variovorax sp. YR216]
MILVSQEKIDQYVASGWWGEQTMGELFIATAVRQPDAGAVADPPNRTAITGESARRWSWAQLLAEVGRLAALLHAQGLRKDDVLVVQLPNCVELHALYLACACSGVLVSPLPMQYRSHEIAHVLEATGARHAVTCAHVGSYQAARSWSEHFSQRVRVLAHGRDLPDGVQLLDPMLASTEPWDAQELRSHMARIGLSAHDVVTICWTSGTEARPKGVPRNHNEWLIVGQSVIDAGQLQPGARMVIPFPFVNMAGISTSLAAWLLVGGELHHHHPFDLDVFISQLRDHPTDYTVAAPAVLSMLLKDPARLQGVQLGRLRRIGSGGGPLADWLVEQFAEQFGVEVVNYFGSNEGAALSSTPQDVPDRRQRTRYFPRIGVPGFTWTLSNAKKVRTRLVDLDTGDDILEPGRIGELRFQGPTIFSGYFNAPELTARAFDEQGYYRTGDLFEIAGERHQFYRFAGRHKDIVIRGGMNISCEEVEGLLLAHPKVREVALIGYPDEVLGERVCAVVVAQPGQEVVLDELVSFLRSGEHVAAFKWPERLIVVDQLPRNPLGKVLKRELRRQHAGEETAA